MDSSKVLFAFQNTPYFHFLFIKTGAIPLLGDLMIHFSGSTEYTASLKSLWHATFLDLRHYQVYLHMSWPWMFVIARLPSLKAL